MTVQKITVFCDVTPCNMIVIDVSEEPTAFILRAEMLVPSKWRL